MSAAIGTAVIRGRRGAPARAAAASRCGSACSSCCSVGLARRSRSCSSCVLLVYVVQKGWPRLDSRLWDEHAVPPPARARRRPVGDLRHDLGDLPHRAVLPADRDHGGDLPGGVRRPRPLVQPADRAQHPEPRRGAVDRLRHPRARASSPRPARPRARPCSPPRSPCPCWCCRWSIIASREAIRAVPQLDPRRLAGARRNQVADHLAPGAARPPSPASPPARSWRCPVRSARRRRCCCSAPLAFVAFNPDGLESRVHRAADPDLQLDPGVPRGVPATLAAAAIVVLLVILLVDELRRDLHPQPLPEALVTP